MVLSHLGWLFLSSEFNIHLIKDWLKLIELKFKSFELSVFLAYHIIDKVSVLLRIARFYQWNLTISFQQDFFFLKIQPPNIFISILNLNQKLLNLDSLLVIPGMKFVQKLVLFPFDLFQCCHLLLNLVVQLLLQCRNYFVLLQNEFVQMDILLRQVQVLLLEKFELVVSGRGLVSVVWVACWRLMYRRV